MANGLKIIAHDFAFRLHIDGTYDVLVQFNSYTLTAAVTSDMFHVRALRLMKVFVERNCDKE